MQWASRLIIFIIFLYLVRYSTGLVSIYKHHPHQHKASYCAKNPRTKKKNKPY